MDFLEILQDSEWQKTILKFAREGADPLQLAKQLGTDVPPETRQLISVQAELVARKKQKFGVDMFLLCDRLALEQASAREVSEWKSGILPEKCIVFDLCCGMGGDSFFLKEQQLSVGIDLDSQRVQMFSHNLELLGRPHIEFCADVTQLHEDWPKVLSQIAEINTILPKIGDSVALEPKQCYFFLDPARRPANPKVPQKGNQSNGNQKNGNQRSDVTWKMADLQPGPEHWQIMVDFFAGGIIKLPPGMDFTPEFPCEQHFLGTSSDCREQVLLCGDLCKDPGRTGFTDLNSGKSWYGSLQVPDPDTQPLAAQPTTQPPAVQPATVNPPGQWLTEPWPPAIRSHIFPELAREYGMWQIDEQIAWLSSDEKPSEEFPGTSWEILDSCSMRDKEIKKMLRDYDYGTIVVKKRGVQLDPAHESRRWSKKKGPLLTMIYTRQNNKPIVFLVRGA